MSVKARNGTVLLDVTRIDLILREKGWSWTTEKPNCDVSRSTWQRIRDGKRVSRRIAEEVATHLGYSVADLVVSETHSVEPDFRWPEHPEWKIVSASPNWTLTANGLYYFRCKVQHRHIGLPSRPQSGAARVYDLTRVPDRDQERMTHLLMRHPLVCREMSGCPWIVENLSAAPVAHGQLWWVIDRWYDGQRLLDLIGQRAFDIADLTNIMIQVARALSALHKHGCVIRELSPSLVLLDEHDQVRLTELDLTKLQWGTKTVSNGWATNIYRAPEVADDAASVRSDFYSWAMTFLHAAAGRCSVARTDLDSVALLSDQPVITSLLRKCLSPRSSQRPEAAADLITSLDPER